MFRRAVRWVERRQTGRRRRRVVALAIAAVLSLAATACSADVAPVAAAPTAPTAPTADETPTVVPDVETDPAPDPSAQPTPSLAPLLELEPPDAFVGPSEWNDPFPVDPAVIDATLDNGLRYLIQTNRAPGGQAQLRLVVKAGSVNEPSALSGVAHFLEHMMFNGTERFPDNKIVPVLESFGSSFGPDVNAYTSYEETVYELTVPTNGADALQLGLDVLSEWAVAASLELDAVVAERGVVREEYRRGLESVNGRLGTEVRAVLLEGTDYFGRDPIGNVDVIEAMTDEDVRDFYERWYQPQLMTIVAVGDFDADDVQRRIIDTFSPIPSGSTEPALVDLGAGPLAEPVFDVFTDAELDRSEVEVIWRLGGDAALTPAQVRTDLVAQLTLAMLAERFAESVEVGESELLRATAQGGPLTSAHRVVSLVGSGDPDTIEEGLAELLVQVEQARQYGFEAGEFGRALQRLQTAVDQGFAESGSRQDSSYAEGLVTYALGGANPMPADAEYALLQDLLDSLTAADAQRFAHEFVSADPYVLVTGPASAEAVLPEPERLAEIYDGIVGRVVAPPAGRAGSDAELMAPPGSGEVVGQQVLAPLGATVVTYGNGARLAYRQTEITENRVELLAISEGGFFAVDGPDAALLGTAASMIAGSGFASVDPVTLDRLLAGSIASVAPSVGRSEETLRGETSSNDLETLLQLVYLSMTEPAITDLQLRRYDDQWRPLAENPSLNPGVAADLELWRLRYGDSPWFRYIPTVADLDGLDADRLLETWSARFANAGDFIFVVVGDFDPAELVELGARYLATLPASDEREQAIDRDPGIPEENLVATVRAGVGDQGRVRINWESPYPFTLEAEIAAMALDIVVDARLRDLIREELGASYSPSAEVTVLSEPKPWIDTIIEVEADPDRVDEVAQVVRDELTRLRAGDIDPQYLDLAVDQLREGFRFFSNEAWLELIAFHLANPDRAPDEYRRRSQVALDLTVDDLVAAANAAFPPGRSVEVRLLPA